MKDVIFFACRGIFFQPLISILSQPLALDKLPQHSGGAGLFGA